MLGGLAWRFAEACGAQGVNLLVSIVLARLLCPEDFGLVSIVNVFTAILNVFVDSGLANALIQKKNIDDVDYSTVFYFNAFFCVVLYILMFVTAPFIANFYGNKSLVPVLRVLCLTVIVSGLKNVQHAYVSRNLMFKKFFYATLGGTLVSAVVGIAMATLGYGVWALVAQHLVNLCVDTIVLWFVIKWKPRLVFSFKRLKILLSFGWKLLAAALIDTVYRKVRQLLIGKIYSSADLAFYNKADLFPSTIVKNINNSIDSVLFPVLSSQQTEMVRVKNLTKKAIKISSYLMWPLMCGLAAVANPLVKVLLTEKWLPCVFYLRIFCFVYGFQPIQTANLNAIKAMGRSDIFLKLEIAKKSIGIIAMLSTIFISIKAMAYSYILTTILSALINAFPNRKIIGYSYIEQLKDILPAILISFCMYLLCEPITLIGLPDILTLVLQIFVGGVFYISVSVITKNESFKFLFDIVKTKFVKKRKENELV